MRAIDEHIKEAEKLILTAPFWRPETTSAFIELVEACRLIVNKLEDLEYEIGKIHTVLNDSLQQ